MNHKHHHPHNEHHHNDDSTAGPSFPEKPVLNRGEGLGKLLFIDAFSGIAGDMMVASLIDLGVPVDIIKEALSPLPITGYTINFSKQFQSGICAGKFDVILNTAQKPRNYATIRTMIEDATHLHIGAQELALKAFHILAKAESEVHNVKLEDVHFHEVGAVDSIVDILATAVALDYINAKVIGSPLPMGRGMIKCQHGVIPLPAPATVLCLRGIPTYDAAIEMETVTPTGACLVAATAEKFSSWPSIKVERMGWGSGTKKLPDRPNLLRLILGTVSELPYQDSDTEGNSHVLLSANIDDMSAEVAAYALQQTLKAGALDAWTTPIGMKKGRPALMISALVRKPDVDRIARILFAETTTLGLRLVAVGRMERHRRTESIQTPYGAITMKIADTDTLPVNLAPEYEDCRHAAETHSVPLKEVYSAALSSYRHSSLYKKNK